MQLKSFHRSKKTQARKNIGAADDAEYQITKASVGTMASLVTTEKTNLVGAINEVHGIANTAKKTADTAQSTATNANNKAASVEEDLNTFKGEVGETNTDFVAVYTAARDGE